MPKAVAFLLDARQAGARHANRIGKNESRSGHRKSWRLELEVPPDQFIQHLVVLSATDAMNELIRHEEPKDGS